MHNFLNHFIADFADFTGYPFEELMDISDAIANGKQVVSDLPLHTLGYNMEIGEFCTRIQMEQQEYEYRWPNRNYCNKQCQLEYLQEAFKYLNTIMPAKLQHLKICPTWVQFFGDICYKCEVLSLGTDPKMYTDYDLEVIPDVGKKDIAMLLNHVEVQKGLALLGPKSWISEHTTFLTVDWLKVNCCQLMRPSHLPRLQNKIINLSDVTLTSLKINDYLKTIHEDGPINKNLLVMTLKTEAGDKWNVEEVLRDLKTYEVENQIYSISHLDESVFLEEFLPPTHGDFILIPHGFEIFLKNSVRMTIEIVEDTLRLFVWPRENHGKRRMSDEEAGPSTKRVRFVD